MKTHNEVYGRSPAMTAIADIKTLNVAMRMLMFGIEKGLQPTVFLPDDSSMNKVTFEAGGVVYYNAQNGGRPFFSDGETDVNSGFQFIQYLRDRVRALFYVDQLQLQADANMTATEVLQRQDEKARLLAPAVGRIQTELLSPLVQRAVAILIRNGVVEQPPADIVGQDIKITYTSPLNRAQRGVDVQNIMSTVQELSLLAQSDPTGSALEVVDKIDFNKIADEIMDARGVTGLAKAKDDDVDAKREQRAQQKQMQQMAAVAEVAKDNV